MMSFTIFLSPCSFFVIYIDIHFIVRHRPAHRDSAASRTMISGQGSPQISHSLVCHAVEKFIQHYFHSFCKYPIQLSSIHLRIFILFFCFLYFFFIFLFFTLLSFCLFLPVVDTGLYISPIFRLEDGAIEKLVEILLRYSYGFLNCFIPIFRRPSLRIFLICHRYLYIIYSIMHHIYFSICSRIFFPPQKQLIHLSERRCLHAPLIKPYAVLYPCTTHPSRNHPRKHKKLSHELEISSNVT